MEVSSEQKRKASFSGKERSIRKRVSYKALYLHERSINKWQHFTLHYLRRKLELVSQCQSNLESFLLRSSNIATAISPQLFHALAPERPLISFLSESTIKGLSESIGESFKKAASDKNSLLTLVENFEKLQGAIQENDQIQAAVVEALEVVKINLKQKTNRDFIQKWLDMARLLVNCVQQPEPLQAFRSFQNFVSEVFLRIEKYGESCFYCFQQGHWKQYCPDAKKFKRQPIQKELPKNYACIRRRRKLARVLCNQLKDIQNTTEL